MTKPTQPRKAAPQPRYIKPETIRIGDTIRITWKEEDVEYTRVGTVASRDRYPTSDMTEWSTARGQTLLIRFGIEPPLASDGMPYNATVTLLQSAPELDTQLSFF